MVRYFLPVMVSIGLSAACSGQQLAAGQETENATVYDTCVERGGTSEMCMCVDREARTRFDEDEMAFIALASEQSDMTREARAEALQSSGYSVTEISSLTQRLLNAEIVIQQTCGAGLMRTNRRH